MRAHLLYSMFTSSIGPIPADHQPYPTHTLTHTHTHARDKAEANKRPGPAAVAAGPVIRRCSRPRSTPQQTKRPDNKAVGVDVVLLVM